MNIRDLLETAVKQGASDLHIMPGKAPTIRVNGDLKLVENTSVLTTEDTDKMIREAINDDESSRFDREKVLDLALTFPGLGHFRASLLHQVHGVSAVFRVVPFWVPSFEDLNLPQVIKRLLVLSHGLVIVAGPTGSGKSTSLAAMVDYINTQRAAHVITIEDPIEYVHECKKGAINQIQIGRDTPNVATALRASLRQDPDVIMLGEMRDLETIRLALTAAETGHLVLATLHASSSPMAISRMIDMFPPSEKRRIRMVLSDTIQAILCQNLVPRKDGGRVAAFEIMLANTAIRHLISEDMISHMESTIQTSGDIGMCTMNQYLRELVNRNEITVADARGASNHRKLF